MLNFLRARNDFTVLAVVVAAIALAPLVNPGVSTGTVASPAHHFVPTDVELPASDGEPAPTF